MHFSDDGSHLVMDRRLVSDDIWAEITATVAGAMPPADQPARLATDQLIQRAGTLSAILRRAGVAFRPDQRVIDMLGAIRQDRRAVVSGSRPESASTRVDSGTDIGRYELIRPLRSFQTRDLEALWRMRHGANFSVPGAGKTTVAYALHAREQAASRVDRMLVVAPLSAFGAWEEEAAAVLTPAPRVSRLSGRIDGDPDVLLVNYQRLANSLPQLTDWMHRHSVHLVVDEAHRAKRGSLGEWGRSLLTLAPLAQRRDILTGTPAPNHPKDLVALLNVLWPGGTVSAALPRDALAKDPTSDAMAGVNGAIRHLYVRTTKEHLRLPPVTFHPMTVEMGKLQQDIYDAMLNRYAGLLDLNTVDASMFAQMGEVAMYLIQAASSPQLLSNSADPGRAYRYPPLAIPPGSQLAHMIETYADHEIPAKIETACRIVHSNTQQTPKRKTLVWSNFPDNLLALEQHLAYLQPAIVYGGVPSTEDALPGVRTRERELARFRYDADCQVLLANPAALAEGASLHHVCHDAIYIDRTFNAGQYLQSLDRIHRLGLPDDTETRIYLLTAAGTIDDRVRRRVEVKMRRLSQMLDDPELVGLALPDEEDSGPVLDDELDLREVLQHLAQGQSAAA
ncbi:SNF2-related protein [Kribbella qitaiheensis]|uniref:SNF2-related protein n=1 Tax=Kribbella qitaiheensis TaxID=1544730 RepID=UPI0036D2DD09